MLSSMTPWMQSAATWLSSLAVPWQESLCFSLDTVRLTTGAPRHCSTNAQTHKHTSTPALHTHNWWSESRSHQTMSLEQGWDLLTGIMMGGQHWATDEILNLHKVSQLQRTLKGFVSITLSYAVCAAVIPSKPTVIKWFYWRKMLRECFTLGDNYTD